MGHGLRIFFFNRIALPTNVSCARLPRGDCVPQGRRCHTGSRALPLRQSRLTGRGNGGSDETFATGSPLATCPRECAPAQVPDLLHSRSSAGAGCWC